MIFNESFFDVLIIRRNESAGDPATAFPCKNNVKQMNMVLKLMM